MSLEQQGSRHNERPVRPELNTPAPNPLSSNGPSGGDGIIEKDELVDRAEDLTRGIQDLEEKLVLDEGRRPVVSLVPHRPTDEEVNENNPTHSPPQLRCPQGAEFQMSSSAQCIQLLCVQAFHN